MKAALVASGDYDAQKVFFPQPDAQSVEPLAPDGTHDDSNVDLDYSDVTWEVPTDTDQYEQDLDALLASAREQSVEQPDDGVDYNVWEALGAAEPEREWT